MRFRVLRKTIKPMTDLQKLTASTDKELKSQQIQKRPQRILYCVEEDHELMVAPQPLRRNVTEESYDVPAAGKVAVNRTVCLIK